MNTIFAIAIGMILAPTVFAQSEKTEEIIRQLEQKQVVYLLNGDIKALESSWSSDYTVNNPFLEIVNARNGPIHKRTLTYSRFTRDVERVLLHGQTAITMGSETVVPKPPSADAGKTIQRRFTDVWMNKKGNWLLVARQASVICAK